MNEAHIKLREKNITKDGLVMLLFLTFSFLMIKNGIQSGKITTGTDWLFHVSRVEQIYQNLKQGSFFTFIATDVFNQSGVGTFLFYPDIFLYPWAFFRFFLNPINSFYAWYFLLTFLSFTISYFAMKEFSNDNLVMAVSFSFLYVCNNYRLFVGTAVFGEFIASTFLPLCFLGFYELFFRNEKKWYLLSIGLSLLTYSHVLSVVISIQLFIFILLIGIICGKFYDFLKHWKELVKAIILTIVLTGFIIFPFVSDYIAKNIHAPYSLINIDFTPSVSMLLLNSLDNKIWQSVGIFIIAALLIGWYFVRKNNTYTSIYILGIICFVLSTKIFPWVSVKISFFKVIQLPYRYLEFACLFLAIIGSLIIHTIFISLSINTIKRQIVGLMAITIIFLMAFEGAYTNNPGFYPSEKNNPVTVLQKPSQKYTMFPTTTLINKYNYQYIFDYRCPIGDTDYYTEKSFKHQKSILSQITYVNNKGEHIKPITAPNKFIFNANLNKKSDIDFPVIAYSNTRVKLDGTKKNYALSKRGTPLLKNINPGKHSFVIEYIPNKIFYLCVISAGAGWILILIKSLYNMYNSRKEHKND
ncbi:hypothetical protein PZE05_09525 [Limosilactobacillus mucosae]|nr:hypothetical protein [Limosilactobacillus mucosae]MDE8678396.1 hypothetical protein [Limosilactobacillus mucosae]